MNPVEANPTSLLAGVSIISTVRRAKEGSRCAIVVITWSIFVALPLLAALLAPPASVDVHGTHLHTPWHVHKRAVGKRAEAGVDDATFGILRFGVRRGIEDDGSKVLAAEVNQG